MLPVLVAALISACASDFQTQKALPRELVGEMSVVGLIVDAERKTPTRPAYIALPPRFAADVRYALEHRFIDYPRDGTPVEVKLVFSSLSRFDPNDPLLVGGSNRMQAWLEVREEGAEDLLGRYEITVRHASHGLMMALSTEDPETRQRAAVAALADEVDRIMNLPGYSG